MPPQIAGFKGLDKGEQALTVLSDFWQIWFRDKKILRDYIHAFNFDVAQSYFDLMEGILATSIIDVPLFHRERWYNLVLLEELMEEYDPGKFRHPRPKSMVSPGVGLFNRIYQPTVSYSENTDYYLDDIYIYFEFNPITALNIPKATIINEDGDQVARVSLWCYNSQWDESTVYENFGYLLNLEGPTKTTELYKALVQGVWKLYTTGGTVTNVRAAANVILGIPIARTDGEEVKAIDIDADTGEQVVITNSNIYRLPPNAPIASTVFPGANLKLFQPLTDIVLIEDNIINPNWPFEVGATQTTIQTLGTPATTEIIDPASSAPGQPLTVTVPAFFIGDGFSIGDPGIAIGGFLTISSDGSTIGDGSGNTIIVTPGTGVVSEVIDLRVLTFNTFNLKVTGNVGSDFLEHQLNIREILRTGLPAYVDFIFSVTNKLVDAYDASTIEDSIMQRLHVNINDVYDGADDDNTMMVSQILKVQVVDQYFQKPWLIGDGTIIGEANLVLGDTGVVDAPLLVTIFHPSLPGQNPPAGLLPGELP